MDVEELELDPVLVALQRQEIRGRERRHGGGGGGGRQRRGGGGGGGLRSSSGGNCHGLAMLRGGVGGVGDALRGGGGVENDALCAFLVPAPGPAEEGKTRTGVRARRGAAGRGRAAEKWRGGEGVTEGTPQ